jgi:hypothetical protein
MDIESFFIDKIMDYQPSFANKGLPIYDMNDFLYGEIGYAFLLENEKKLNRYFYAIGSYW